VWVKQLLVVSMESFQESAQKLPDEPRPVPAGISAMLVISRFRA
jgi:hypothetical protein